MNPDDQDCAKCGARVGWEVTGHPIFYPVYCDGKDRVSGACLGKFPDHSMPARADKTLHDHEHLHWRCRRCGFEVLGPCADVKQESK